MNAFDVLGHPVRRRILEILSDGERSAGDIAEVLHAEHGLSQPAVSQHLKVLRDNGFATVRVDAQRRHYSVDGAGFAAAEDWLGVFRRFWADRLDALAVEIARGKRDRRR